MTKRTAAASGRLTSARRGLAGAFAGLAACAALADEGAGVAARAGQATLASANGSTKREMPVAWLGSTTMGRWVRWRSTGTAEVKAALAGRNLNEIEDN